jgi:hypothetical protein
MIFGEFNLKIVVGRGGAGSDPNVKQGVMRHVGHSL